MHFSSALRRRLPLLTVCFIVLFTFLILLPLKNPPSLDDGLRHVTVGRLMAEYGIGSITGGLDRRDSVKGWGDFFFAGYFTHHNSDPWFLSDVLFMPLGRLPIVTALKVSILCSLTLILLSAWIFFRSIRLSPVTTSFLLLLTAWGEMPFFARLFLGRPFPLMTAIIILTVTAILHRKWIFLPPLLCIATLLSHLFVLPLGIGIIGAGWLFLIREKKQSFLAAFSILAGVTAGLLLHPAPLSYLHYLVTIFIRIPFLFAHRADMGSEMYSAFATGPTMTIVATGAAILLLAFAHYRRKVPLGTLHRSGVSYLAFLIGMFFCAYLVWMRSIDILWPLLVMLFSLLVHVVPTLYEDFLHFFFTPPFPRITRFAVLILLLFFALHTQRTNAYFLRTNFSNNLHRLDSLSLIPPGSRVLNFDWGPFALFFSQRPDLKYATGIDTNFTALEDPEGARLLAARDAFVFDRQKPATDLSPWLSQVLAHFPAQYIVFPVSGNENLYFLLKKSPLVKVFSVDTTLAIFRVRNGSNEARLSDGN